MIKSIKRFLYRRLSLESYLRMMQLSFFAAYRTGVLRLSRKFDNHYHIRRLVGKGDTVVDIGANLGYYSIPLSRLVGARGHVYSVEPLEVYNRIFNRAARRRRNITLLPYALGREEGEITMVNELRSGYLNTGLPHVYDPQRDGRLEDQPFVYRVEMKRPSGLFGELERIDYVKCDIEGLEYEVLDEMKELLARHRPIVQVEVWEHNEEALTQMFSSIGYAPFRLVRKGVCRVLVPAQEAAGSTGDYIFLPR